MPGFFEVRGTFLSRSGGSSRTPPERRLSLHLQRAKCRKLYEFDLLADSHSDISRRRERGAEAAALAGSAMTRSARIAIRASTSGHQAASLQIRAQILRPWKSSAPLGAALGFTHMPDDDAKA